MYPLGIYDYQIPPFLSDIEFYSFLSLRCNKQANALN